jgi:hypothetical protein
VVNVEHMETRGKSGEESRAKHNERRGGKAERRKERDEQKRRKTVGLVAW